MVTSGWRATWRVAPMLAAGVAVLGILALYWSTAASIVAIWIRSETFTHGFVIVPICLWLAWRRRDALAATPASPSWPALGAVLAAGALWFLASVGDVVSARQFALVFIVQAAIVTVLGTRIARAAFFPLAFLLFAVPFGEIFVPTLIDWTANLPSPRCAFQAFPSIAKPIFLLSLRVRGRSSKRAAAFATSSLR
jgi:exosortase